MQSTKKPKFGVGLPTQLPLPPPNVLEAFERQGGKKRSRVPGLSTSHYLPLVPLGSLKGQAAINIPPRQKPPTLCVTAFRPEFWGVRWGRVVFQVCLFSNLENLQSIAFPERRLETQFHFAQLSSVPLEGQGWGGGTSGIISPLVCLSICDGISGLGPWGLCFCFCSCFAFFCLFLLLIWLCFVFLFWGGVCGLVCFLDLGLESPPPVLKVFEIV